eukprot:752710-Hanusia_phi.AAC.2
MGVRIPLNLLEQRVEKCPSHPLLSPSYKTAHVSEARAKTTSSPNAICRKDPCKNSQQATRLRGLSHL